MLARAALPAFLLILLAFVLFLLTTLSVPYIKSIWLLAIDNNAGTRVKLGVFSACYTTPVGVARELGISSSGCLPTKLGYQFYFGGESIGSGPGVRPVMLVETGLSRALVLNPITVAFSGISLIWAFCAWFFAKRVFEMITFVSLILTVIFGWVAFGLNYAVADTARSRLSLSGPLGNGVWMTLAGAIALTLATIAALVGMFGKYSEKRQAVHVKGDGKF